MPGRRLPDMIGDYLGECRPARTAVEKVMEQCGLAKFMGDWGLTDFDPLIVVMTLMTEEVIGLRLNLKKKHGRKVWLAAMAALQEGDAYLEHNETIPCRWCDKAFIPVIDDGLF